MARLVLPSYGRARRAGAGRERGAAAVEFALILPVLMYLVFGIISFGYMLSFRQALSQAAAEGARAAAVAPADTEDGERTADALAAINDAIDFYGVSCSDGTMTCSVEIQPCTGGPSGASCALVEVSYPYQDHSLLPSLGLSTFMPENLTYSTEVRVS